MDGRSDGLASVRSSAWSSNRCPDTPHNAARRLGAGADEALEGVAYNSASFDRHVISLGRAGVDLARTADAGRRVRLFQPLTDPAHGAADGEHRSEHGRRNAQRLV